MRYNRTKSRISLNNDKVKSVIKTVCRKRDMYVRDRYDRMLKFALKTALVLTRELKCHF